MNAPLINARLADLPQSIRLLFDPAVHLARDVQFLPRSVDRVSDGCAGILVGGLYALGGILGAVVLTIYVFNRGSDLYKPGEFWGTFLVYLVFLAILINFARLGARQYRVFLDTCGADRERKAGRLRQGLFLTDDWLVLRMAPARATALPRESVLSAVVSSGVKSTVYVVVRFRAGNDQTQHLTWERLELENKSAESVCDKIQAWRNDRAC